MSLPLSFRLQASRQAGAALSGIHGLALIAVAASRFAWPLAMVLSLVIIVSCSAALRVHALRTARNAVVAGTLRRDGELELERRDGRRIVARIEGSSTVLHWLVALQLREDKRRRSLVLLPDMMDADAWRHLAVALRAQGHAQRK